MANDRRRKANQTPQRNTRQSPRSRSRLAQRNISERESESEHEERSDNDASNSGSDHQSDHNNSIDYLGNPPSAVNTSNRSNDEIDFLGNPPSEPISPSETNDSPKTTPQISTRQSTKQRPSKTNKPVRKQTKPKKRKDRVTKELVYYQSTTNLLIPRLPFQRLVREVLQDSNKELRLQSSSLNCLQEAAEVYVTQLFEDSYLCCLHRSRLTLTEKDMRLVQILRGPTDTGRR